jgi:hypothetical protein
MHYSQSIDLLDSDMHNICCFLHRVYAAFDGAKKGEPGKLAALLGMLANEASAPDLAKRLGTPPTAVAAVRAPPTATTGSADVQAL